MKDRKTPLGEYFGSLLPKIEKKNIRIDLMHSLEELRQIVKPMYELDFEYTLDSAVSRDTDYHFKKNIKGYRTDPFKQIQETIAIILKNEDDIIDMVDKELDDTVVKYVIDFRKLNIIQYVEALNFFNEFARRWILALAHEEYKSKVPMVDTTAMDKHSKFFVSNRNNVTSFSKAVVFLSLPVKDYLKSIKSLGGITVDVDAAEAGAVSNKSKLDPHGNNLIPVRWNPIYHIGLAVNAWRIARHNRNKEELAKLQLTLLALQEARQNASPDKLASIEKQIAYHSNRQNKLAAKVEKLEEED